MQESGQYWEVVVVPVSEHCSVGQGQQGLHQELTLPAGGNIQVSLR